jgi:hypothetical protein
MRTEWAAVRDVVINMTDDPRTAVRITNLTIAATAAYQLNLIATSKRSIREGARLRDALITVALDPLPQLEPSETSWNLLARSACNAVRALSKEGGIYHWIASSQEADPTRKTRGAYPTPMPLAHRLAERTIAPLTGSPRAISIIDPSVGSGALLIAALGVLGKAALDSELKSIVYNLYGVEIDSSARELCCLLLWLAAARAKPSLKKIANNIVIDNAITRDWWQGGIHQFDALVMNPPWESLRHQVSSGDPSALARTETIERLQKTVVGDKDLPPLYTAQGTGDRNLCKAFIELAPHLLKKGGHLGALIPAAFASDLGMSELRRRYLDQFELQRWTSFENLRKLFPIDGRYKFGILTGKRSAEGTTAFAVRSFATDPHHIEASHILLTRKDIKRLGGPELMFPELCSRGEIQTLSRALNRGAAFFERGDLGLVNYQREIDLTLDRELGAFTRFEEYSSLKPTTYGEFVTRDGSRLVPLVEGRMVGRYDFFQKSWINGTGRTAQWSINNGCSLSSCRPQFVASVREPITTRVAICDVTSATNTRTVHATWVPPSWPCGNTAPVLLFENVTFAFAGLAILNSMVFDWLARRIVAGLHLNKFYLETLVWPTLTREALKRTADAAYVLCVQNPRFAAVERGELALTNKASTMDFISANVVIEQEVARGYGLTARMLSKMFTPDSNERRGFWRHFASDPRAVVIANRVVAAMK